MVTNNSANTQINSSVDYLGGGNTTGSGTGNVAIGPGALGIVTSGPGNVAIGSSALAALTTATGCVAIGNSALQSANANNNTAIGGTALQSNLTGTGNSAFGGGALNNLTSGIQNLGIGSLSGFNLLTGARNTMVGNSAGGSYATSESDNICIGTNVFGTAGESATIRIGINGTQTACVIAGITGVTVTGAAVLCSTAGKLGTVVSSERFKENIKEIKTTRLLDLIPVSFNYKAEEEKRVHFGFIAEEVEKVIPELCIYDSNNELYTIAYHEMYALLVNEIKKLNERIRKLEGIHP